jgi:ferredoxin
MKGQLRLRVDPIACTGHGICRELLPEMIRLDDWGYPIVDGDAVQPSLMNDVRRAVTACPALALRLERIPLTSSGPDPRQPASRSASAVR